MAKVSQKDIAEKLGTTIATVSRVLSGKEGVGEEMREKVLACARDMGYQTNYMAASMSRAELQILTIFPEKEPLSFLYTDRLRQGYEEKKKAYSMQKICFHEVFDMPSEKAKTAVVKKILAETSIDALLCYPVLGQGLTEIYRELYDKGIPVIVLHKGVPNLKMHSLITDDGPTMGRLAAELMQKARYTDGTCLLVNNAEDQYLGGDEMSEAFCDEAARRLPGVRILEVDQMREDIDEVLDHILAEEKPAMLTATTARASFFLTKALKRAGHLSPKPFFVAAGLNPLSSEDLRDGLIDIIIDNDPLEEGALALEELMNILILKKEAAGRIRIPARVIMQSNL